MAEPSFQGGDKVARPIKQGLEYFPLDLVFEDKIELIEAEFGLQGFAVVIKLYQKIYQNGYFAEWDDDVLMLYSLRINTEKTLVNSIITRCLERKIFDREIFNKYKVLTSNGIQKRYLKVCKDCKRKHVPFIKEYLLCNNSELIGVISEFTSINSEETPVYSAFSTQSKVKKSKEKESKEEGSSSTIETSFPDFVQILEHFNYKANKLQNSPKEIALAKKLIEDGIPVQIAILGINEAFEYYKPYGDHKKITTLTYCEGRIRDLWIAEKEAQDCEKDTDTRNRNNSRFQKSSRKAHTGQQEQFDTSNIGYKPTGEKIDDSDLL